MLFTAYMDESDTHGREPNITISAMLSTAGRWERCARAYARLRGELNFSVFHGTEFRGLQGEFKDWPVEDCLKLLNGMGELVAAHVTEVFTVHCRYETYKTHFLDKRPQKMGGISQLGICFMGALDGMMRKVLDQGTHHKLSVVMEDGHPNAPDTARLFRDRKARLERAGTDILGSHTLAAKKDAPLLQLADATAHGHALEQRAIKRGDEPHFSERHDEPLTDTLAVGWTISEVTPLYLEQVIEEFNSDRAAAEEDYLKRKQAWLDAKAASSGQPV